MSRAAPTLLIAFAVASSACALQAPPTTSPTLSAGVVGGRVTMGPGDSESLARLTVHVAGTPLSTAVGSTGEFVLPNVPEGPLTLLFSGPGTSSAVDAGSLAGGETVTLVVTLAGVRAALVSIARVRGSEATIEGVIDTPDGALPPGTIIVAGRTVTLPAGRSMAGLAPGVRVRIAGVVSGAGIIARDIVIQ